VTIRPLEAGDLPAITELARICDETYLEWAPPGWTVPVAPRGWADGYLEDDAWGRVAYEGEQLIASIGFRGNTLGLAFVHPSRWRQGIASRMLRLAEDEMRSRGIERAQLWPPLGAPAERFYAARGWVRDGRREWHPWVGLEMVGYSKDLA
jgi:GNAT superfamily N-acetyltransferase